MKSPVKILILVLLGLVPIASAEKVAIITQHGITWTFDKPHESGRFVNGDYWVIGPVTITKIDPAFDGIRNGTVINPTPNKQGYDSRAFCFDKSVVVVAPVTVEKNSSIVTALSFPEPPMSDYIKKQFEKNPSFKTDSICFVRKAAVLTVLDSPPPSDSFRPPYVGSSKPIFRLSAVKRDRLLKLKAPASKPKIADYEKYFDGCWLDQLQSYGGWYRNIRPVDFIPDYSRDTCEIFSIASLLLLLDNGNENMEKLLVGTLQVGIDYYGICQVKNDLWRGGSGQGSGRKWPIVFAGILFDNAEMTNVKGCFGEDDQTYYYDDPSIPEKDFFGHPWRGVKSWTGSFVLWSHFYRDYPHGAVDHEFLPPSKWNEFKNVGCDGGKGEAYRVGSTSHVWVGEALACRLMGGIPNWNHDPFFDYVDRWMTEKLTPELKKEYEQMKTNPQTGVSYQTHFNRPEARWASSRNPFVDEMWNLYRGKIVSLYEQRKGAASSK